MDYKKEYQRWISSENLPEYLKKELQSIKNNEAEIQDRFYQDLTFGTAGLRGKLGAGLNRMNELVVLRAGFALGRVINEKFPSPAKKSVAICYDCRIKSDEFAMLSARVMATLGIKAYIFKTLHPTPMLSYAVRYLGAVSGINITASHNPKEYNGYKVYWQEGSQIKDDIADLIYEKIKQTDLLELPELISEKEAFDKKLIEYMPEELGISYYKEVLSLAINDDIDKDIKIVYTPLNGTGNIPVRHILKERGFKNVYVVKEQEKPDGTFPTTEYPNPEELAAFELAEKYAEKLDAELIIATDPDADRLAVEVRKNGRIIALNGNQTGVLMINYILNAKKEKGELPKNAAIVKSIVTGNMGENIAKSMGVKVFDVLTGFKNICALANEWDKTGEYTYIFGYEESIGYNPGVFVRDKDAVSSAMLLAEMAGYYKKQGKTLIDVLDKLFEEYGCYSETTKSIFCEGESGKERIDRMMKKIRETYPEQINGSKLKELTDYELSLTRDISSGKTVKIDTEKTNAVKFLYDDESWVSLRPSGTEPKIKIYIYTRDEKSMEKSISKRDNTADIFIKELKSIK